VVCILFPEDEENELLFQEEDDDDSNKDESGFEILGSSINGTLCLRTFYHRNVKLILWNPTTNEFKVIPPSLVLSQSFIGGMFIIFLPLVFHSGRYIT